ncbi:hypothetical protein GIB67_029439 [Kingdonia uniflora]|uniref:VHS domain-containing protein n=1 Tax=Kingdonia uniflora TaxID=39325 RepID=A0A7J7NXS5_9MAGN|nr:hypothetical protein GIB67_029439 [Kingdonia uniflora]
MSSMSFMMKELFNCPNQTDKIVEDATSETLNELDWATNLEIYDLINSEKIKSIELIRGSCLLLVSSFPFLSKVSRGIICLPVEENLSSVPELPPLEISEMPTFVYDLEVYKVALDLYLGKFSNLDKADSVVFNTFYKLESKVMKHMRKLWNVLTIRPTIPSMYLDKRMEGDKDYGLNLF